MTDTLFVSNVNYRTLLGSTITTSTMTVSSITVSTITASTIFSATGNTALGNNVSYPNRFVEVSSDVANSMYLDFHSSDAALPDYSTRIQSLGGATTGTGNLNMYASTIGLMPTVGVGIGTTAPSAALHVYGSNGVSLATTGTVNYTNTSILGFGFGGGNTGTRDSFRILSQPVNRDNGAGPTFYDYGAQANLVFVRKTNNLYSSGASDMTYTEVMRIHGASGFVGIGTNAPLTNFEVYNNGGDGGTTQANITSFAGGATTTNSSILNFRIQGAGGGMVDNQISAQYNSSGSGNYSIALKPGGTTVMTAVGNGNVGIGTTNPYKPLHISGNSTGDISALIANTNAALASSASLGFGLWPASGSGSGTSSFAGQISAICMNASSGNTDMAFSVYTGTSVSPNYTLVERMRITAAGNVGIGITNPSVPLYVSGYTGSVAGVVNFINTVNTSVQNGSLTNISIFASNGIQAGDYIGARSDQRIKKNIKPLTSPLEKLSQIEVVSYDKIDFTAKGSDCGVIAQNIKEILPRAVTTMTDYLPNIYAIGTHNKDDDTVRVTVVFTENTIKVNVKVKLYVVRDEANNEVQTPYEVIVIDYDDVSITVVPWDKYDASDRVFVYGVEHDDIMSVEKDQIGILAAAGVKELHPLVLQQSSRIGDLETQLAAENTQLKSQLALLEVRLAAAGL